MENHPSPSALVTVHKLSITPKFFSSDKFCKERKTRYMLLIGTGIIIKNSESVHRIMVLREFHVKQMKKLN